MPLTNFICPDGEEVLTQECVRSCRLGKRCLTRSTLKVIGGTERSWDGVPHVTSLLNGTMLEYLRITEDYAIDPTSRAFALLGSMHHKLLEDAQEPSESISYSEVFLNNGWVQGTCDLVEMEDGVFTLTDFKTWGSGKLNRAVLQTAAGWRPVEKELYPEILQINMYRVLLEQTGHEIERMQVQVTVRDHSIQVSQRRGIDKPMFLIPMPMLQDDVVLGYFKEKARKLSVALDGTVPPDPCNDSENWFGRRCSSYCDVSDYCEYGCWVKDNIRTRRYS